MGAMIIRSVRSKMRRGNYVAKEIGSEFHRIPRDNGSGLCYPASPLFTFSGRTAIETILKEMPGIKKALLPSYCCDSVLEPFRRAGVELGFYPVNYKNGLKIDVEIPKDIELFFWCNYFGFHTKMPDMKHFIEDGGVIVEDITHSLLSDYPCHIETNYLVASLRKWEPLYSGGYCASMQGKLHSELSVPPPLEFLQKKQKAMELKAAYLEDGDEEKKRSFLHLFEESNSWVSENYSGLMIDDQSRDYLAHSDIKKHKQARRQNAEALYKGLDGIVQFLFPMEEMDCPLFVPIILPQDRNRLRQVLIREQIYCPIHWPHPKDNCESNLYEIELSLICDQRYTELDMQRIINVIRHFMLEYK